LADRKTASHSTLARRTHRPSSPSTTPDSTRDVAGLSNQPASPGKTADRASKVPDLKIPPQTLATTPPAADSIEYKSQYRSNAHAFKVANQPITLAFSGRVLDLRNNPLPNAYVYVNNGSNNYATTTNMDGFFKLRFHPEDSTQTLNVALVGYKQASIGLNSLTPDPIGTTSNVIRLKEIGSSLDEVVVSGYGSKRRETRAALASGSNEFLDTGWIRATPVIGRPAYLLYLQTSKKSLALDTTIRGAEIISFEVGQKGELTNFRIEASLSPAHDAGLIRVVSEGPAWRLVRGKTTRAVVSLLFP
jgi:CarboxypepD_reg-like domain